MCGVFGVYLPRNSVNAGFDFAVSNVNSTNKMTSDVAKMTYFGLYALQHRGQESAGIATSNGSKITVYKDLGLVSQVFNENVLSSLTGYIAVGHTRYSTTGSVKWENAQPTLGNSQFGTIALTHNGNIVNSLELKKIVVERYGDSLDGEIAMGNTTDTALITSLLQGNLLKSVSDKIKQNTQKNDQSAAQSATNAPQCSNLYNHALEILPQLKGAFSLVFMDEKHLYAARDTGGIRPLIIGTLPDGGYVVASENSALEIVGATPFREVEPGELIRIDENGIHSDRFAAEDRHGCVFEYVYLARPDAYIFNQSVHASRVEMGKNLAKEYPVDADLVIPVPESGNPAAVGYAQESKIPFAQGLTKNSYVGRTFIQPTDQLRKIGIRLKLNPLKDVIEGKRLIVVDDSIVRGNTQKALVSILREYGAKEVHVRISSPPVKYPCYYGIDFADPSELLANQLSVEDMKKEINADSLGFLSEEGMISATHRKADSLCLACFKGKYPVEVQKMGKFGLE